MTLSHHLLLQTVFLFSASLTAAYDIGCLYPPEMPDPMKAQDIMIKYLVLTQDPPLETPITVHNSLASALCGVGCLATHDPTVQSPITRTRPLLVVPDHGHNAHSIALCNLQCHVLGSGYQRFKPLLDRWNVNITEGVHPELRFLLARKPEMADLLKAVQVVQANDYHPFLMGQLVLAEMVSGYFSDDGWNFFGNFAYDPLSQKIVRCSFNCALYADLSGYYPRNHPGMRPVTEETKYNITGDDIYWQPLLEHNGLGYFSRQEHVVPHLATTAKPFLDENLRNRSGMEAPNYNYYQEALQVVEELRLTAEDPDRKAKIAIFDNKLDVRGMLQHATRNQFADKHSYQKMLLFNLGLSMAEDDGIVLAWTEKLRHDLVRPTTVIQRWGRDKLLTYGGDPNIGQAVQLEAHAFQAFIRVMPHSEFPSGSSCLCTTYREFTDAYTMQRYGQLVQDIAYGHDEAGGHSANCDGEVGANLTSVGCNYSFRLKDMKELEEVCGQSRLWGGMHFTKSVPAGHELCSGLGTLSLERLNEITADSDFAGNEFFAGGDRPVCSDPSFPSDAEVSRDGSSSSTNSGLLLSSSMGVIAAVVAWL